MNKVNKKKERERNDKNNCLPGYLRGKFLDSKAKPLETVLNILEVL